MRIVIEAYAQLQFLKVIYQLFKESLPRIEVFAKERQDSPAIGNANTLLRSDIRAIPFQLQQVQIEQHLTKNDFNRFLSALHSLLLVFESLINDDVLNDPAGDASCHAAAPAQEREMRSRYPKLAAAIQMSTPDNSDGHQPHILSIKAFDPDEMKISHYKKVSDTIRDFNHTVEEIFWDALDALDQDHGNADALGNDQIAFIQRAYQLNSSFVSSFKLLAESTTCLTSHSARIHLSELLEHELDLHVATCQGQQWQQVKFRCCPRPSRAHGFVDSICYHLNMISQQKEMHIGFHDGDVWVDSDIETPSKCFVPTNTALTLRELLEAGSLPLSDSENQTLEFEPEDHKIFEVLLAYSLFHLYNSPWLQESWNMDHIFILATSESQDQVRWKPYLPCTLEASHNVQDDNYDDILSFGILIMEMETKKTADLSPDDYDYETGCPSKDLLLQRIMREWKRKLGDGYRRIVKACLRFRELADGLNQPDLGDELRRPAAIYKYILGPLHHLLTKDYSDASRHFAGIPSTVLTRHLSSSMPTVVETSLRLTLFDDSEQDWHGLHKRKLARDFMKDVDPWVETIRQLSTSTQTLAPWWKEKIRIAILDTGIDSDDELIKTSQENGRIKYARGFAGDAEDSRDKCGHGTHVTRLLLKIAPAAELYVGKVSDDKYINANDLHRISEAINWACDANVNFISMSFGLESRNVDIDKAIHKAFKHDKIIFAAAANSGGRRPRAFPASRPDVVCIHASDGNGNDGGISPTSEPNKDNFTTLGLSIESRWQRKPTFKSGTSFATPIAVGLVANVLEFARHRCNLNDYERECLYRLSGITGILRLMSKPIQNYDFVSPRNLWDEQNTEDDIISKITKLVK